MYKCNICNKNFNSIKALNGHKAHHNNVKEVCKICGVKISHSNMRKHIKAHEHDGKCLKCGKRIPKNRKFCSRSCSNSYNNIGVKRSSKTAKERQVEKSITIQKLSDKKCLYCNKIFHPQNKNQKFCSQKCSCSYRFLKDDEEYLRGEKTSISVLKRHYIYHNEYKCSICGISKWNEKELVLILDHIDGNPDNNNPNNLRMVCPNCDSQLPTFKGRNKGHGRFIRRQRYTDGKSY